MSSSKIDFFPIIPPVYLWELLIGTEHIILFVSARFGGFWIEWKQKQKGVVFDQKLCSGPNAHHKNYHHIFWRRPLKVVNFSKFNHNGAESYWCIQGLKNDGPFWKRMQSRNSEKGVLLSFRDKKLSETNFTAVYKEFENAPDRVVFGILFGQAFPLLNGGW